MSNKAKIIVGGLIALLLVCAVFAVIHMNSRYDIIEDMAVVKMQAEKLYEEGDIDTAIIRMETYCAHVVTDIEAKTKLGDWYYENGDADTAYIHYYEAAYNKTPADERIASMSVKDTEKILLEPVNEVSFEITPDVRMTKDMTLRITSHNIVPYKRNEGKIFEYDEALTETENYLTTEWFIVSPEGEYLTMSGGFNCAVWQFRGANGMITDWAESTNVYRREDTYDVNVYQMARAKIPEDAVACRVTYFDKTKKDITAFPEEALTIVYGRLPGESKGADYSFYEIPDLKEGEKIVFENSQWTMITEDGETVLEDWKIPTIEKGSHFTIGGLLPGRVSFEKCSDAVYDKNGIYTIRFDAENPTAAGQRMDDAKNLGFNASVAEGHIALGENHFDNIYPWSEIKLCNIKDGEVVAYEGESGFSHDGTNGDVFVEIPKFYVRRVVDSRYDTISVSGVQHEGFFVDDAFKTKNGEADKIYVAAYLTSIDADGLARSHASVNPEITLSPREIKEAAQNKGAGYTEIDYAAISALQKLFLVETGLRNSQYLFMGVCAYTLPSYGASGVNYAVALNNKTKSNCIDVNKSYTFVEGNTVVIFDSTDYEGTIDKAIEDARKVTAVISNGDGTQSVYFSGDPINIHASVTGFAHIALENGTTRSVNGHTGALGTDRGSVSFKYRNIENLWGNIYVYVDNVEVVDGLVTLTDRAGVEKTLSYKLPDVSDSAVENMVRRVGYDDNMPGVLLPCEVGRGATISTFYGDAYLSDKEKGKEYVLHYGGAWNSRACAGLFAFVTSASADETHTNTGGRMMYIPE